MFLKVIGILFFLVWICVKSPFKSPGEGGSLKPIIIFPKKTPSLCIWNFSKPICVTRTIHLQINLYLLPRIFTSTPAGWQMMFRQGFIHPQPLFTSNSNTNNLWSTLTRSRWGTTQCQWLPRPTIYKITIFESIQPEELLKLLTKSKKVIDGTGNMTASERVKYLHTILHQ